MNRHHTIYSKDTGRIVGCMTCSTLVLPNIVLPTNEGIIENGGTVDGEAYYYDLVNTLRLRPENRATINKTIIIPDNIDTITISGLPIPTTITVEGQTYEVTDGVFEFSVDLPGTYIIKAEAFPYLT